MLAAVYATPEYVSSLATSKPPRPTSTSTSSSPAVRRIRAQLLEVIGSFLAGREPRISGRSVCMECKERGNVCVMVAEGTPCLGPVTHAGCGAICPAYDRGCYGCFGPKETPNTASLSDWWRAAGRLRPGPDRRLPAHQRCGPRVRGRGRGDRGSRARAADERRRADRRIEVGELARVEGEGALHVRVRGGSVEDVRLEIFEPPRFFEAMLRGRRAADAPDVTSRICGICPIAYQVSASAAIESALGIEVDEPTRLLRRLIYCGEWLESHSLHVFMLHAPDFLGYDGAIEMARDGHRDLFEAGLLIKRAGNALMRMIGGRADPPGQPQGRRLPQAAAPRGARRGRRDCSASPARSCSRRSPGRRRWSSPIARSTSSSSPSAATASTRSSVAHLHRPRPAPLTAERVRGRVPGDPRPALDRAALPPPRARHLHRRPARPLGAVQRAAARPRPRRRTLGRPRAGLPQPVPEHRRALRRDAVRRGRGAAADRGLRAAARRRPDPDVWPEAAGSGWSEAPRGMLWHRYELAEGGRIRTARIVAPTSQNLAAIELDLRGLVRRQPRPRRRRAAVAMRAGGPQLRPVHLLLGPLPEAGVDRA